MNLALRPLVSEDKSTVECILKSLDEFSSVEVDVAIELIDAYLQYGISSGYYLVVAEKQKTVLGYICYGPTPMTQGTWDIYWIAVDPRKMNQGIGSALLKYAEQEVRAASGRLVILETSSKPVYARARKFYEKSGYEVICRISDFYALADDKIIYLKNIGKHISA